ncbi:MAG: hypothetical protein EAZ60_11895 [Oscillatoriales cyanobacterium]|nr:MAG: hypothetical protein EAZ60_11895 [Oscillatoriales cyanobacterium]
MQLTPEYKSAILSALEKFELEFSDFSLPDTAETLVEVLIARSIRELKKMNDFLAKSFTVCLPPPKRNSKVSLSHWASQVLADALSFKSQDRGSCSVEVTAKELLPFEEAVPVETETLDPEPAPIYKIRLLGEYGISEHRVSQTPPYLIDLSKNCEIFQLIYSPY